MIMFKSGMKVETPLGTATVVENEVVRDGYSYYNRMTGCYDFKVTSDKLIKTGRIVVKLDNPSNWSFKNTNPAMWPSDMVVVG